MWSLESIGLLIAVVSGVLIPLFLMSRDVKNKYENMNIKLAEKLENVFNRIVQKFEEHEKEDDRRFENIKDEIWQFKVLNAAKDGVIISNSTNRKATFDQEEAPKTPRR